jgi:uncharacterized membrane protein YdjX (TVP38/TMEM64 family)
MDRDSALAAPANPNSKSPSSMIKRLAPLAVLLAAIIAFFALGLHHYLSFDVLRQHREQLLAMVAQHPFLAPLAFVALYAAVIALSVPGGAVLTIAGGFLFGVVAGSFYVVVAATLGATIVFLIAKTAVGDFLRAKAGPRIRRMEEGFREDAFSYLLVLRLIPIFPFWLVNIVPAFLGVGVGTYVLGTFLGIIPGSLVFASVGNGLGAVFDAGQSPDLGIIFKPAIIGPIIGLALLALLPIAYRKLKARKSKN